MPIFTGCLFCVGAYYPDFMAFSLPTLHYDNCTGLWCPVVVASSVLRPLEAQASMHIGGGAWFTFRTALSSTIYMCKHP